MREKAKNYKARGTYINDKLVAEGGPDRYSFVFDERHIPLDKYIQAAGPCVWEWDNDHYKTKCGYKFMALYAMWENEEGVKKPKCPNCGRCIEEKK